MHLPPSSPQVPFRPSFTKTFPSLVIPQAEKYSSQQNGDPQLCFWAWNKPFPSCRAGPQAQHAREQFGSRALSRLAPRSQAERGRAASPH